jgi:CheY-like chemotaxis protein
VKPLLAKTVTPERGARTRSRTGSLRVLLVDDEDLVRRCTARILSGFEIVSARSGAEALAILSEDADFDVVLSDVMMPEMTGPDLFEQCCESHPRLAQRFVFASGDPENARQLLRVAVKRAAAERTPVLLTKPTTRETLMQAVFAAAGREPPRSGTWAIAAALPEVKNYRG